MTSNLGFFEKGGQMWYTCKCGVGTRVYPIVLGDNNKFVEIGPVKVIQVAIMHDIKDGLYVTYHCDNGCSYTESIHQQNLVHRTQLDAIGAVRQLNHKLLQAEIAKNHV